MKIKYYTQYNRHCSKIISNATIGNSINIPHNHILHKLTKLEDSAYAFFDKNYTWFASVPKVTQWGLPILTHVTFQDVPSTSSLDLTTDWSLFGCIFVGTSDAFRIGSPMSTLTWICEQSMIQSSINCNTEVNKHIGFFFL